MKKFVADLHIHSYLSRATSKNCNLPNLDKWAQLKGVNVVGTGDLTHPQWLKEMNEMLEPAGEGLYRLKKEFKLEAEVYPACRKEVHFLLTSEISNIYKRDGKVRKVHNVVLMPNLAAAEKFHHTLDKIGNVRSDGRPILGLDSRDLLEIVLETDPQGYLIPAHIWTPWFSALGSKSGFDAIEDCYADLSEHIFAVETGLSSDPPMNWRVSSLDKYMLVSNSDAHSPQKLAREANLFETEMSYPAIFSALKDRDFTRFRGTLEFFPEEGKYHLDGHRKCQTRMSPEDTSRNNGLCPVCGKPVTVGVLNRVNALADRPIGYRPENAPPFHSLIPLPEIISEVHGVGPNSKTVQQIFHRLLDRLGPELDILMQLPLEEIGRVSNDLLVEGIRRVREKEIHVAGGYDGEFGTVHIFEANERERLLSQTAFLNDPPPKVRKKKDPARPNLIREEPKLIERQQDLFLDKKPTDTLFQLNSSQMAAMTTIDQPLLIIAGPGTGKTRTLTHRLAYLVREKSCPPESILAITFTRYAANEMRERLALLLPDQAGALSIGTFHSIGYQILAEHADLLGYTGKFSILSDSDRHDILRYLPFDFSRRQIRLHAEQISLAKNKLQTATDFSTTNQLDFGDHFSSVFQQYEVVKKQMNGLDYDDLLLLPYQLLSQWPAIAAKYQSRYKWIAVDEYQDINLAQYHFLRVLMGADTNICAIGDPNQAIYGFRGADIRYFDQFTRDFPKAKSVELSENYRSSRMILNASSQMISANPQVARQNLWSKISGKTRIEIIQTPTEKAEAEFVVHQIEKLLGGTGFFSMDSNRLTADDEAETPHSFSDFAVLYRTSSQAVALEEAFLRSGMPYQTSGAVSFFERRPIKDVLAYLRLLNNPKSDVDVLRVINTPPRGLGDRTVDELRSYCLENRTSLLEGIENQSLIQALNPSGHKALDTFFSSLQALQFETAKNSVKGIIQILLDEMGLREFHGNSRETDEMWGTLIDLADSYGNRLDQFLADTALTREVDIQKRNVEKVSLMTIHASKGLEFPIIFIVGCENDLIPFRRNPLETQLSEAEIQEERRLLYVGMTRAEQRLFLTHSRKRTRFGREYHPDLSPFLKNIEAALKEMRHSMSGGKKRPKDNQLDLF